MMLSMAFVWDEEALLGVELEVDMCDAPKVPHPGKEISSVSMDCVSPLPSRQDLPACNRKHRKVCRLLRAPVSPTGTSLEVWSVSGPWI